MAGTERVRVKMTTASVAKHLVAPDDPRRPTMIYDTELSGFGAYRASARPGSYFIHYRVNRQQRKKVIARVNEINVADARDEAARIKLAARQGTDLLAERKLEADQAKTLGEAYAEYLELLKRRNASPRTFEGYEMNWRLCLSAHSSKPLRSISKADLRHWHSKWGQRGATTANHVARLFRAVYNHALKTTDGLPPNPEIAVDYFPEKKSRKRLEWEDLPDWLGKVRVLDNPTRRCFWRFLLYTGLRRSDACSVRWDDIEGDWLHRPCPKGGEDFAFDLPLSQKLHEIIRESRRVRDVMFPNSPYVFPANSASGHLSAPKEKAFLEITPHMLRRSFATACVEAGLDPYTTKRLLNHRVSGNDVTSLYVQPSRTFLLEKMEVVSEYIAEKGGEAKLLLPAPLN